MVVAAGDSRSAAGEALRSGDVIAELTRDPVREFAQFIAAFKSLGKGGKVLLRVVGGGRLFRRRHPPVNPFPEPDST